jgi:hypothetical protein
MVVRRIGPVSCAKIAGTLYTVLGLFIGACFSLAAMAGAFASSDSNAAGIGTLIGAGSVLVFPILYGVLGFVMSLVAAWLYNLVAGMVGGIELDVQ